MKPKRVSVTRKWKRVMAVGCSHGFLIDPVAEDAILRFKKSWAPDMMVHLGDFTDTTAFRAGAAGTNDETQEIRPDIDGGLDFLEKLRCNLIFCGNHEDRVWRLSNHYNAITSMASKAIKDDIEATAKMLKADLVPWHIMTGWRPIGNYLFGHGYMYNENCPRDHAEAFGNCVIAHWHRTGQAKGRRSDNPTGYCVGTLTRIANMDYAKSRRSTLAWDQGFVWGEYTDNQAVLWLHEQPRTAGEWVLPL